MSLYIKDNVSYVQLAIESVLNQSIPDFDLYIIADGPVSPQIDSYISSLDDERIIIKRRNENKGLAESLNELLDVVLQKGYDYIARMDADDIAVIDRFEKQVSFLEGHPEVDIIGGAINIIDENGEEKGRVSVFPIKHSECFTQFAKRVPVAHPTVIFRRRFFEKTHCLYPTEYLRNEDTALWLEGFKHGVVFSNLPDVVLNFRETNAMYYQRRGGRIFAKSQLELRKKIKKELVYGYSSVLYAYAVYLMMLSPGFIRKAAYKLFR